MAELFALVVLGSAPRGWGCATFSKGDPAGMCGAVVACPQVLARYNKRLPHAGKDGG